MDIRSLKQCAETLDLAISQLQKKDGVKEFSRYRAGFHAYFFDGNDLKPDLIRLIPVEELDYCMNLLRFLRNYCGYMVGGGEFLSASGYPKQVSKEEILPGMKRLRELIRDAIPNDSRTVFYSWQSHLQPEYYQSLIEDSIQSAIGRLNDKNGWELSLDRDTLHTPGAPDIVETVLEKIDKSAAFIADISINATLENRSFLNPNVLFELGYAWKALGKKRVILAFNEASGAASSLPFDFRRNKAVKYHCAKDDDMETEKEKLSRALEREIELALSAE